MIVTMSSPYKTTNGNQPIDHLDSESKSSVNIATEILEAQRIVTRRLQQRREKEKNQRQKIYETTNDNITGNHSAEDNKTTTTTTTTTYNTRLDKNYSPLSFRKSTLVIDGHSNNNSSDEDNDDATKIDDSFNNSDTEEINMSISSGLKEKTEISNSNADDEVDEMNYYMRPDSKSNKFSINKSLSTPSSFNKIYPSISNSVSKSNTFLKLSKEETLVNDDNRKEPSLNKYNKQNISTSYQSSDPKGHVNLGRKMTPPIQQNIQNNDDYFIEEEDMYKDNRIRSITTRSEYWKSLWDHVRSPFTATPVSTNPTSGLNSNTEKYYNKIINNLNKRLDNIQFQINAITEKTDYLVKDSEELSKEFNNVKYNEMFTKFNDDLEQISNEINHIQDSYKDYLNSLFDKEFSPNNEKLIKFENEINSMKTLLDNYKTEIEKISSIKMSDENDFKKLQEEINSMNDKIIQLDSKASFTSTEDSEKINENEKKLTLIHNELTSLFNRFEEMERQFKNGDDSNIEKFDFIHKLFESANERLSEVEDKMNKLNIDRLLSFEESDQQQNIVNYIDLHNRQKEDHEKLVEMENKWDNFQNGYSQTEKDLSYISGVLKALSENQEKLSREYEELVETFPEQVADITEKTIRQDFVGLPDFALESGGARVISKLTSETYQLQPEGFVGALSKLLGVAIKPGRPPTEAIQPTVHAGECWGMKGSSGVLTLKLSKSIIPTQITLEHLSKEISFSISSAPRFIEIYAIHDIKAFSANYIAHSLDLVGSDKPYTTLIGKIEYDPAKKSLQTFDVDLLSDPIQYIQFQFLENWGHSDYTCIYRVRVHGTPVAMTSTKKEEEVPVVESEKS
ncbi:hypothetical protein BCR36DRAFT_361733 [Piromyces finnis]|uniref:SUN domain-containing protein n=1 Tax=Piromyces finnis TaxID=1754191 RepID=A0A1Y1UXV1_9FUNG|nr:hypothetical protein BCR36DRAFT_361733 [Piromyces finnis]|eukprot:ORX43001.1 hypothetical protein BCR36DRAFT_361733 [Piromyces finnis]